MKHFCSYSSNGLYANVPIAHLHGGELTKGNIDESIRHSISKMSHIHLFHKRIL